MKNKEKFIIVSSIICIILSIAAVSFSMAWYAMYPVYKDITVTIGDSGLSVNSRIFIRNTKETAPQSNIFEPSWNNADGQYNAKYHDDTKKGEGSHPDNINTNSNGENITHSSGTLTVTFPNLNYNLFNPNNNTYPGANNASEEYVDPNGGILDEETMSIDIRYLTFALFELNYTNGFFSNFLYADMATTLAVTSSTVTEADLSAYASMIQIRQKNEVDGHLKTKVHFLDEEPNNNDNALNKDILSDVENYTYTSTAIQSSVGSNAGSKYILTKNGYVTDVATLSKDQVEIKKNDGRNFYVPETNFYSHAQIFTLSFDPILFMDFLTKFNHVDTSLSLTVDLSFHAAGNVMTSKEVEGYGK